MLAGIDSRVTALFGIDPVNGASPFGGYNETMPDVVPEVTSGLGISVDFIGETTNGTGGSFGMACAPLDQNYQTFFEGSTSATWAAEHTFEGADHMDFVSDTTGCGFTCSACTAGSADPAVVLQGTYTLAAAFFLRHLDGDGSMEAFLTGTVPPGVTVRSR